MRKLPDWAVVGARVITSNLEPMRITRVSEVSVWTQYSSGYEIRWKAFDDERLTKVGADRWDSTCLYPVQSKRGLIYWREFQDKNCMARIQEALRAVQKEATPEAVEDLITASTAYLQFLQHAKKDQS